MKIRHTRLLAILILLAIVLAACGADVGALQSEPSPPTDTPAPLPPATQAETPQNEPQDTQPEASQSQAGEATIAEAPPEPTPTQDDRIPMPELGFERGAPQLKASDLSQFVKAAGKPQLVELFAFW